VAELREAVSIEPVALMAAVEALSDGD